MRVDVHDDPERHERRITVSISDSDYHAIGLQILELIHGRLAEAIADRYLAEHAADVLASIDPQVVATMAVAQIGARIASQIEQGADRIATTVGRVPRAVSDLGTEIYRLRQRRW